MCDKGLISYKTIISKERIPTHIHKTLKYIIKCNDCGNITYSSSKKVIYTECIKCRNIYYPGAEFVNGSKILEIIPNKPIRHLKIQCACGNEYIIRQDSGRRSLTSQAGSCCKACRSKLISKQSSTSSVDSVIMNVYKMYSKNAELRNLNFSLTIEEFKNIIFGKCHYCGTSYNTYCKRYSKKHEIKRIGVDRLNNKEGYNVENCLPCCRICNKMKGSLTYKEFTEKLIDIKEFLNNKS